MNHPREPVGNTCPDIDKVIKVLGRVERLCKPKNDPTVEELQEALSDISWEISGCDDILESLRKVNHELRQWAIGEAELVDKLEDQDYENCFTNWKNSLLGTDEGQNTLRGKSAAEQYFLFERVTGKQKSGNNHIIA